MTTYEQYRQLRLACGYDDDHGAMIESVWDGCDPEAQESMLRQLRRHAERLELDHAKFGGDHW